MKTYKYLLLFVIALLGLSSCHDQDDAPALTSVRNSVLDKLPFQNIVLAKPTTNPLLCTITWTETQIYLNESDRPTPAGPMNYTLEIDTVGANFKTAQTLAVTSDLSTNIMTKDLNKLLTSKLGCQPQQPKDVEIRIVARYGENSMTPVISGNTLYLTVTPYLDSDLLQPIYLIGDMNGWSNTNTDYLVFRDDNDPKNPVFIYTGKLGGYFKFCPEESLGTDKMYCNAGDGKLSYEARQDGAFFVDGNSYKTIRLNIVDMTWTIEDYDASAAKTYDKIGPIGEFCGWNNEPALTKSAYDAHQWHGTVTFQSSTTCKFRGNNDWVNNWGGSAKDLPYGKAVFDGPGAAVQTPGTYNIYFNDLTGHYGLLLQK